MVTIYRGSLADGLDISSGKLKITNDFFLRDSSILESLSGTAPNGLTLSRLTGHVCPIEDLKNGDE